MFRTCSYVASMPKMIQLRHVPDDLHRTLKVRAALEGVSLSDYLLQEIRRVADRPTLAELRRRLAQRTAVTPRVSPAKAVRAEREGR
jgi:antitoxin FitA